VNTFAVEKASPDDLEGVLELFDSVQAWLVTRGSKEKWGDEPFSKNETQRQRFAVWLADGDFFFARNEGRIIGALVFSPEPPAYARAYFSGACTGRVPGGYLEAFAIHRDYAAQGVGKVLLSWAEGEAQRRGLEILRLDCWAENVVLRAYYRHAGFLEVAPLTLGGWRGVLFEKLLKARAL